MRDFKNMKRQRSRNRSGGGGGGKPQHNANRAFDSNGPDGVKVRGAAQHVFEKYQQLARDAQSSGDRVLAENYLQHAEHYFRVLRAVQPNRPVTEIMGRESFASGYDIDFEDESLNNPQPEPEASVEGQQEGGDQPQRDQQGGYDRNRSDYRQDGQRQDGQRQDGGRQDGGRRDYNRDRDYRSDRDNREGRDRYEGRSDRGGDYRDNRDNRDNRDSRDRYESRPRDDRPKDDRPRDERPRDDRSRNDRYSRDRYEPRGGERNGERADPLAVVEPQATPLTAEAAPEAGSPVLRAQNGDVSHAPAFLQTRAETPAASEAEAPAEPKKRRGRPPKKAAEVASAE
jgi:hypothetical protein